MTNYLVL